MFHEKIIFDRCYFCYFDNNYYLYIFDKNQFIAQKEAYYTF